jgi:nicotinamidase-related amidase
MVRSIYIASILLCVCSVLSAEDSMLHLTMRSREQMPDGTAKIVEKKTDWDAKKTAIIICDMWDKHWCQGASDRVGEMASPMNDVIKIARAKGAFIIHSPSDTMEFYKDTPQRKRALTAPSAAQPAAVPDGNWKWCRLDQKREGTLPIDDSDGGCDCSPHCKNYRAWKQQITVIDIMPDDAITDKGNECWNMLAEKKIDNVILCGVHLNMCVLGRPFGIRSMTYAGKNMALMRDMTDTMYNHEKSPQVSHFKGTELMIEHVEKNWCPSFESSDISGAKPFKFKDAK